MPPDMDAPVPAPDSGDEKLAGSLAELKARAESLERQLTEIQHQTEARLIRAELKSEALRAGMIDIDGLKLIDQQNLTLNADGEVEGAGRLMDALRKSKPWLFGGSSSSSASAAPAVQPPRPKLATEMTEAEYRAARAALLRRRT